MVYCFVASVLPVWTLLQPRDYINSHQLMLALGLLILGLVVACLTGEANLVESTPAVADAPADAPPIWPFLFITIACGAVSGFHCLVSSGTSSKQIDCETDAQYVGYGAMLLEGALAVIVILACCAGVGMGLVSRNNLNGPSYRYDAVMNDAGEPVKGREAWRSHYDASNATGWKDHSLPKKVGAFIEGGGNFISSLGVPLELAIGIVAVLVASFAATTLDTATRLQRYVVQEMATTLRVTPLQNKYAATAVPLVIAAALAVFVGEQPGEGGMILWPLFGATNQLLAGLAFMVTVFYLWRRSKPILFAAIPMLIMLLMPAWAMMSELPNWIHPVDADGNPAPRNWVVIVIGIATLALEGWMMLEALVLWPRVKGVAEVPAGAAAGAAGGPNC